MRFVLLLALLVRLLPTPAHAADGAHCVASDEPVATQHAGHHAPAPASDTHADADHDDCPHCPPSECAAQSHCSAPTLVSLAADTPHRAEVALVAHAISARTERWPSRAHQPLLRPPLSHA